jgi:hypothetical protein
LYFISKNDKIELIPKFKLTTRNLSPKKEL